MSNLTQVTPLGAMALNLGINARSKIDLEGDTRTLAVQVAVSGDVTIAVANATRILNGGSIMAALTECGIKESGEDTFLMDGLSALALSRATNESDSDLAALRLTSPNIGTASLREVVWLPITLTRSLSPIETALVQISRGTGVAYEVFTRIPTLNMNGILVTPGAGGTATLSNVAIEVIQVVDLEAGTPSLFLPRVRQVSENITAANPRHRMKLSSDAFLRGILIQQLAEGVGEVNDIINRLVVRNDRRSFIGPNTMRFSDVQTMQDRVNLGALRLHGGVNSSGGVYTFIDFADNGRLSNALNPLSAPNFRLELDAQPSVTAGALGSRVQVTLLELIQAPPFTVPPKNFQV